MFNGADTKAGRKVCPRELWPVARRKMDQLNRIAELRQLALPPGNELEALRGDREGQHSVRINDRYRVCFRWVNHGAEDVEIVDYH